jgi:hypothetical protein
MDRIRNTVNKYLIVQARGRGLHLPPVERLLRSPLPSPPPRQQIVSLSQSSCVSAIHRTEGGKAPYKSDNPLRLSTNI